MRFTSTQTGFALAQKVPICWLRMSLRPGRATSAEKGDKAGPAEDVFYPDEPESRVANEAPESQVAEPPKDEAQRRPPSPTSNRASNY